MAMNIDEIIDRVEQGYGWKSFKKLLGLKAERLTAIVVKAAPKKGDSNWVLQRICFNTESGKDAKVLEDAFPDKPHRRHK